MVSGCRRIALGVLLMFLASWCRADIPPEAVLHAKQATALVDVEEQDGVSEGSAFCIDATGLFVTNAHVVEARELGGKVLLVLRSGEKDQTKISAHLVAVDKEADLALLQADKPLKLVPLSLGSTEGVVETMSVVAFGYPFGSDLAAKEGDYPSITVSMGHVTALRKVNGILNAIQLDASLNPGNSGGPVLDSKGEVIGIVREGIPGSGINFAIPIDALRTLLLSSRLAFTPPAVSREHLLDAHEFHIQLLTPPEGKEAVTVEMTLSADPKDDRHFLATSTDGRNFTVSASLLPVRKGPEDLQISMWSRGIQIIARVPDHNIRVAGKEVALSRIKTIEQSTEKVTLTDNQVLYGRVTGLKAMEVEINGARSLQDLSQFEILEISPAPLPTSVEYTVTAKQGGKKFGELHGALPISEAAGSAPALTQAKAIEILIACYDSNAVKRFDGRTGQFIDDFASGSGMEHPVASVIGPDGNLYVSGNTSQTIHRYSGRTGQFIDVFVPANQNGGMHGPNGLTFGPDGNLYVSSFWTREVKRFNGRTGVFLGNFIEAGSGGLDRPGYLKFGPDGNLYVGSLANNCIKRYNGRTGEYLGDFISGNGLGNPSGFCFGADGRFYVCNCDSKQVKRFNARTGEFLGNFADMNGLDGKDPVGIAIGPDGNLYVTTRANDVKRFDGRTGKYIDTFISGNGINYPLYLFFRPAPSRPQP